MSDSLKDDKPELEVRLDSRTIELGRFFDVEGALPRLLVLVEDADDKVFWQRMFSCVEDKYAGIDIWPLQEAAEQGQPQYAEDGRLLDSTGKDQLVQLANQLGKNFMIAVDADYDWLIDNYHTYSLTIRQNPFVQHTEYYSIENHLLDNDEIQSHEEWKQFCTQVEPLVYIVVGEIFHRIDEEQKGNVYSHQITINDMRGQLGAFQYHASRFKEDLISLVDSCSHSVAVQRHSDVVSAKQRCSGVGSAGSEIWKVIQGHTLYEFVEKYIPFYWENARKSQEQIIKNDTSIPGPEKGKRIKELKKRWLDDFKTEKAKFRNDVYSCVFLSMNRSAIKTIQDRIISASKQK